MADVFKFPDGYDVNICRKQDIVDCIENNIVDKDIAYEIIEHLEITAIKLIEAGHWVSIPYMGSFKNNPFKEKSAANAYQELMGGARQNLSSKQFIVFKKRYDKEAAAQIKFERYYRYITSSAARKYKDIFKSLCKTKGETYARIYVFALANIISVENEYELLDYDEQ